MEKDYVVFDLETTGLLPWEGDVITCICAKDNAGNKLEITREDHTEAELIIKLAGFLMNRGGHRLITKNGKGFDIPFILARMVINGIEFRKQTIFLNMVHLDLQTITKKWIGLDDMAKLLGCDTKNGSGLDAIRFYNNKEWDKLKFYCMNDVNVTEQVALKLNELGVIIL